MNRAPRFPLNFVVENPWTAAQRFLQANELPLSYLDEVVKFIEKNTTGVSIGAGGSEYSDPYTGKSSLCALFRTVTELLHSSEGAARYQPTGGNVSNQTTGGDPFTGASRYQPSTNTSAPPPTRHQPPLSPSGPTQSGFSDPFTGANRYQPSPSPGFTPTPSSPNPSTPSSANVIPHVR